MNRVDFISIYQIVSNCQKPACRAFVYVKITGWSASDCLGLHSMLKLGIFFRYKTIFFLLGKSKQSSIDPSILMVGLKEHFSFHTLPFHSLPSAEQKLEKSSEELVRP